MNFRNKFFQRKWPNNRQKKYCNYSNVQYYLYGNHFQSTPYGTVDEAKVYATVQSMKFSVILLPKVT